MDSLNTLSGHGQTYVRQLLSVIYPVQPENETTDIPRQGRAEKERIQRSDDGNIAIFLVNAFNAMISPGRLRNSGCLRHQKAIQAGNAVIRFHWLYCVFLCRFQGIQCTPEQLAHGISVVVMRMSYCEMKRRPVSVPPPHVMARAGL